MSKKTVEFVCSSCGHIEPKWVGRCSECKSWNSFVEQQPFSPAAQGGIAKRGIAESGNSKPYAKIISLEGIQADNEGRISSGIPEVDYVLGGGLVPGSAILIGGEPGIGKSTLMMQIAHRKQLLGGKVLYISGEESETQLKLRSLRLGISGKGIELLCETSLEGIFLILARENPSLIIVDSVQTLVSREVGAIPGTVNQIKFCAYDLIDYCKEKNIPLFLTAHVTKEGQIAGPKVLEHMVDTVLYFESGESDLRVLRTTKNRFGASDESCFFLMKQEGLQEVVDPSSLFLTHREGAIPDGITACPVYEGSRAFAVEIQALTTPAKGAVSRTFSDKVDSQRVSRIAAVLEKMLKLRFSDQDLYINVAGGIRLTDPCVDLAIAAALYSARTGIVIDGKCLFCGEVSLAGELRSITQLERRIRTAQKAGFEMCIIPKGKFEKPKTDMKIIECSTIYEAMKKGLKLS